MLATVARKGRPAQDPADAAVPAEAWNPEDPAGPEDPADPAAAGSQVAEVGLAVTGPGAEAAAGPGPRIR